MSVCFHFLYSFPNLLFTCSPLQSNGTFPSPCLDPICCAAQTFYFCFSHSNHLIFFPPNSGKRIHHQQPNSLTHVLRPHILPDSATVCDTQFLCKSDDFPLAVLCVLCEAAAWVMKLLCYTNQHDAAFTKRYSLAHTYTPLPFERMQLCVHTFLHQTEWYWLNSLQSHIFLLCCDPVNRVRTSRRVGAELCCARVRQCLWVIICHFLWCCTHVDFSCVHCFFFSVSPPPLHIPLIPFQRKDILHLHRLQQTQVVGLSSVCKKNHVDLHQFNATLKSYYKPLFCSLEIEVTCEQSHEVFSIPSGLFFSQTWQGKHPRLIYFLLQHLLITGAGRKLVLLEAKYT